MVQLASTPGVIEKRAGGGSIRLQQGDLTALQVDAVVYYAREDLTLGSGHGTAIQSRGGEAVRKELAALGRVGMGAAVITGAGGLEARHIIHACGPKFQEERTAEKLRNTMQAALELADAQGLASVAFPPMGAGFYGVPLALCATVMVETIREALVCADALRQVTICVTDRRELEAFRQEMEKL
jgi:O-acetyl-ADP-ribose deacetylase (regulator of RNase III)